MVLVGFLCVWWAHNTPREPPCRGTAGLCSPPRLSTSPFLVSDRTNDKEDDRFKGRSDRTLCSTRAPHPPHLCTIITVRSACVKGETKNEKESKDFKGGPDESNCFLEALESLIFYIAVIDQAVSWIRVRAIGAYCLVPCTGFALYLFKWLFSRTN